MNGYGYFECSIEVWFESASEWVSTVFWGAPDGGFLLEFSKMVSLELSTLLGDIYPQAAMPTYGRCALNFEAQNNGTCGLWSQVDVATGNIWTPIIFQWKKVYFIRNHRLRSHCQL